jgi:citrate synthase
MAKQNDSDKLISSDRELGAEAEAAGSSNMECHAELRLPEATIQLPIIVGSEQEKAIDISKLRSETGYVALDPGYGNTGSCLSKITYIDGEKGILRYRGYPIEELAEKSTFVEVAYLLIRGELPTAEQLKNFRAQLTEFEMLHEGMQHHFEGFPPNGHPMAILSAMINACSCYHPELMQVQEDREVMQAAAKLISKVRTIASFSYKKSIGQPMVYPDPKLTYCRNFLHMMFTQPYDRFDAPSEVVKAFSQILILHADHEQNCSTSTVRMVGSSQANLFASVSAGVCALWGPLHGGANVAVINMLETIHEGDDTIPSFVEKVKQKKTRLMGFGHRVYREYDPRARILSATCNELLAAVGKSDPLLDIARELEQVALHDDYFLERNLYPNVDFYSGIILRAMGIPLNMFTVLFAIGRMPGWIAQWCENARDPAARIDRPRQIYEGASKRSYISLEERE